MINKGSPESGLAQRWAPRLRAIFSIVLCLVVLFCCIPFEVSAASSTSNYWYNGVELPPLPPDGFEYSLIFYNSADSIALVRGSTPLYYDSSNNRIDSDSNFSIYLIDNGSWSLNGSYSWINWNNRSAIWSSANIFVDDTDEVFFSSEFPPLPYYQHEIYSYNGFLAPTPFDYYILSDSFKYFCIFQNRETFKYNIYASVYPLVYNPSDYSSYENHFFIPSNGTSSAYWEGSLVDGVWTNDRGYVTAGGILFDNADVKLIWSSVDVVNEEDNSVYMEGSEAVKLGNLTSLFTVLPEDDNWEVKQGSSKRFQLASSQNLDISSVTWELKGNVVAGTSIDYSGLLTVSDSQPLGSLYVVASNINGHSYSSEAAVTVIPAQTVSGEWVIRTNHTGTFYAGNSYQFYLLNPTTSETGATAVWSIYSPNTLASGTTIDSSGLLTISANQQVTEVTVQASSINGEEKYTSYTFYIFSGSGGGDSPVPTPTPGTQDVIDNVNDGFDSLENKLEDTGNNIINGLLEGLLRLFVPTSEELSQKMDDFKAWIDEKIPILAVPVALVQYTYDMFFGVTPELGVLTFPEIKWMDNVLIQETELNLGQYTWLSDLLPIIRTVLTAGCCLAFVHWIIGKVKEVGKS